MDIRRYEAFVAAVETKSMSGAAKRLGYTPSGIIRLINALESELGFPVLVRSSTGVALTAEGEKMLPILAEMTRLDAQVQQTSARIRGLAEGTLTVGALFSLSTRWLPAVLSRYQRLFPAIKIEVAEASDIRLVEMLEEGSIDCAVFHGDHAKLDWTPLGKQELVAWLPPESPLARHGSVLLAELDGQPYIRIHPKPGDTYDRLFESKALEPDVRFTVGDCCTAYEMVSAGLGYALCVRGVDENWNGNVTVRPLSPQRFLEFGIATLPGTSGLSPAVEEFINVASKMCERGITV